MAMLKRVDHLNVQVPPEKEDEAKHFYGEILGLSQLTKPDILGRSGAHYCLSEEPWYELHLGIARGASVADIGLNQALLNHLGFQVDDLAAAPVQGCHKIGMECLLQACRGVEVVIFACHERNLSRRERRVKAQGRS